MVYGCFLFQVKQRQKKSSSKWTCVVCNEKQSVRKVYAQGPMAMDVRKFVQAFNMSRKFMVDEEENLGAMVCDGGDAGGSSSGNGKKRRSDWSEYLDPEENEEKGLWIVSVFWPFVCLLRKCTKRNGAKLSFREIGFYHMFG